MSVLKRRNRLVSFRLSEEEYEALRVLCVTEGARSVSDFARSKLWQVMDAQPGTAVVVRPASAANLAGAGEGAPTRHLIDSMERLSSVIVRLSQLIESGPARDVV